MSSSESEGSQRSASRALTPKKKAGRRKINIEYIDDKNRRQITFSKRKAGLMKKVSNIAHDVHVRVGMQRALVLGKKRGLFLLLFIFAFHSTPIYHTNPTNIPLFALHCDAESCTQCCARMRVVLKRIAGIRTHHAHWNASAASGGFRNRSRLHFRYSEASAIRHQSRGQSVDPELPFFSR
jgi:hypothetical protein